MILIAVEFNASALLHLTDRLGSVQPRSAAEMTALFNRHVELVACAVLNREHAVEIVQRYWCENVFS